MVPAKVFLHLNYLKNKYVKLSKQDTEKERLNKYFWKVTKEQVLYAK